ncbi:Aldo/keto reductase [Artomyces pyxidatus]|uniref:Aldo/keto reductase n=1 Tax=Artomyces pyxidatus TaxID=48021 RepID=A0ACB8TCR1_9AGAM|nr:Aldo/keto reductase [Artomyces pyxidatus]
MSLPTRKIGDTTVSAIGFGAMGLSAGYGKVESHEEGLDFLDEVLKRGCTFWDTSDAYLDNEELIGKWFARSGRREDVFLATKFGLADPTRFPNGDPDYVREEFARQLKKLQTDYVDLYYLHRADPTVPIEKTVGAMAELVKQGKVKYLGISEVSSATLRRAHAVHPIAALQVEYSPIELAIESEQLGLLKTARELGIAIVAYSPLGRGLLSGQYTSLDALPDTDFRKIIPRIGGNSGKNFDRINVLAQELARIGAAHSTTAGQVTLAWLLAQGDDVIPIPGTKKVKYLEENLGALKIKLSDEEVKAVRQLAEKAQEDLPGARYPEYMIKLEYSDTPALA